VEQVDAAFPPVDDVRPLGPDAAALAAAFGRRVFVGPVAARSVAHG
jgi:hypothetical protein